MNYFLLWMSFSFWISFSLISFSSAETAKLRDPINYRSPLDESVTELESEADEPLFPSNAKFPSEFLTGDFLNVAACQQKCTSKFNDLVKVAIRSPNHLERFAKVCDRYNETLRCMDESDSVCMNQEPFNVFTSGLYFMCIDQRKAFEAVIECVDAQANEVQRECDEKCQTKGKMANWAIQSGLLDNLIGRVVMRASNGVAGFARAAEQKRVNPEFARRLIQEGCDLAQCSLSCVKVKFNTRCHRNAGTLLSEALVRPLAETQKLLGFGNMQGILNIFMPRQCEFVLNSDSLNKFRIDPTLNENLKRLYENEDGNAGPFNMTSMDEINDLKDGITGVSQPSQFDDTNDFGGFGDAEAGGFASEFGRDPPSIGNDNGDNSLTEFSSQNFPSAGDSNMANEISQLELRSANKDQNASQELDELDLQRQFKPKNDEDWQFRPFN